MPRENTFTSGTAQIDHLSPAIETNEAGTLNLYFSYEEALKLHMALQHRLLKMAAYNKSTKEGKRAAVNLTVFLKAERIAVNEGRLLSEK